VSEGEIRPFHDSPCAELLADDLVEELASRECEQPRPGPEHADFGGAGLPQQGDLALGPEQGDRRLIRPQESHGMRIEGNRQRRSSSRVGPGAEPVKQHLVTAVDAVEVSHRHDRAAGPHREVTNAVDRDHRRRSPLLGLKIPLDQPERPSWSDNRTENIIAFAAHAGQSCQRPAGAVRNSSVHSDRVDDPVEAGGGYTRGSQVR
jgi:hypothetical protein